MVNQQLADYIKQQLKQNASKEQIKGSLMGNGWTSADVEEGFASIAPAFVPISTVPKVPLSPNTISSISPTIQPMPNFVNPSMRNTVFTDKKGGAWKKIILILIILAILGAGGWFAYRYFIKPKANEQSVSPIATQPEAQTPTQVVPPVEPAPDPDIAMVNAALVDIRQAYLNGDNALLLKHTSVATAKIFSSGTISKVSSFTVNSVSLSGANILANIITVPATSLNMMVFIKEDGDWKFDLAATIQLAMDQNNAKAGTGNPNGLPDLVVTGVTMYPSHPIVNSKDVQITVTIKNIGTKTSDGGAPLVATLLGFAKETPVQGGSLVPLTPGETVTWDFHPYDKNDFFKVSDTPGQKTIQIVLNKYREIVESNYDNDIFTQMVQMYSN